ncbi:MAG TPA: acetyl-CoA carboxylase biotin carboxylase subunit [bacterium]|nr:acetyl-CoA carboxylase biotin carboxylase subunit [bacterium]HNB09131.1 acetyl-CoA carboxylase biotin carboxylase subunit [bacterium]HND77744.1 acetyl-CoA carboxylase biotin carboxylase subunit [bacterium]HNF86235.1 acetyl-CoA carboxylase biotin carboxylase subunit [bacterium]HNH30104.1 acetyl-CoA carboxylase biotin carboxylase subunit [bacterium]
MSITHRTIKKILIANRGEIAIRVIRACREMNIKTVAVFSEADRTAAHVRLADEAYCIGEPPSNKSYLRMDKIIEVAKKSGADAIHPGYGFLSENEDFADLVIQNGIIFIGPSSEAMAQMGSKTAARTLAKKMNVPTVPGTESGIKDKNEAITIAEKIGFPVLIKAAAGGGGKGMRVVQKIEELSEAIDRARGEALNAFGDDTVFIEKYVTKPRHIEIQIIGDQHGNMVYLGERECSIQRRHQKVIEEAPSAIVTPEMRKRMGESAVRLAQAVNYYNAGTMEFLVDADMNFYFLEMNTRLQVEHPVTEMVTGIDIVKEQIRIASGEPLSFRQEDIRIHGHAIESRIYAEDCENNFAPSIGRIEHLEPSYGPGIREDSGVFEGDTIQIYYDPMISKLAAWGPTREEAINRMRRSLREYAIVGVETTIPFCLFVMENEKFRSGDFDTSFVGKEFTPEKLQHKEEKMAAIAAAVHDFAKKRDMKISTDALTASSPKSSRWKRNRN